MKKQTTNKYSFLGLSLLIFRVGFYTIHSKEGSERYLGIFFTEGVKNAWRKLLISWHRCGKDYSPIYEAPEKATLKKAI